MNANSRSASNMLEAALTDAVAVEVTAGTLKETWRQGNPDPRRQKYSSSTELQRGRRAEQ
jgi:hypothetical protein